EAVAVHAGGGFVGLIFAGLYQSPSKIGPQLVDIALLVWVAFVPSWLIFKAIDACGHLNYKNRRPLRLKSTAYEENLGLIFDDPTTLVGSPPVQFHYLPKDLQSQLYDYLHLLTSVPIHIARQLYEKAEELISGMKRERGKRGYTPDLLKLEEILLDLK